jgi:transposase-like protein
MSKLSSIEELFAGRHFDREVIILCVRWYLRYKLSFRDLVEMIAERVLSLAHTTIMRWVRRYASEFVKRWNALEDSGIAFGESMRPISRYAANGSTSTEPWIKPGRPSTSVSRTRDVAAAKAFFKKAIRYEGRPPHTITHDGYAASHRAVREMRDDGLLPKRMKLRSSIYRNNLIEQDHRGIKSRTRPMLGFKSFASAANAIAGIELLRRIHKRQFALSRLRRRGQAAPAIWNARACCINAKWLPRSLPSNSLSCLHQSHQERVGYSATYLFYTTTK